MRSSPMFPRCRKKVMSGAQPMSWSILSRCASSPMGARTGVDGAAPAAASCGRVMRGPSPVLNHAGTPHALPPGNGPPEPHFECGVRPPSEHVSRPLYGHDGNRNIERPSRSPDDVDGSIEVLLHGQDD